MTRQSAKECSNDYSERISTHSEANKQCYMQAGLDVMLSVPRRANDAMYVNMLHGYDVSISALCFDPSPP